MPILYVYKPQPSSGNIRDLYSSNYQVNKPVEYVSRRNNFKMIRHCISCLDFRKHGDDLNSMRMRSSLNPPSRPASSRPQLEI
jgi:hypothetical protein